jgi:(p)ppGpp synthase/HD superfamily hydrolase
MPTQLTDRFLDAVRYANQAHEGQTRKGTAMPYISHLLAVASFVLDEGADEDSAIAALLHDVPEDDPRRAPRESLEDIRRRFGDKVAHIVEGCTDSWERPKRPWIDRKRQYVEHARSLDRDTLRVSAADKVHNAYTILRNLRDSGESVWQRFNGSPDEVMWYYGALVRAFREAGGGPLVDELDRVVRGIKREMGY